ncbi:unnamed protein product [Haemonchus placei]|uniref:Uncharacterized protein n=1 Tax=Haemonchus placei TaxID=6290 RepID=A0A3P8C1J4_HAEPC|nr:unnamed protein product [Haemonchus placei]
MSAGVSCQYRSKNALVMADPTCHNLVDKAKEPIFLGFSTVFERLKF